MTDPIIGDPQRGTRDPSTVQTTDPALTLGGDTDLRTDTRTDNLRAGGSLGSSSEGSGWPDDSDGSGGSDGNGSGRTAVAKDKAADVASGAGQAAQSVGQTAKEQAAAVASETKAQTRDLLSQGREEIRSQAGQQQQRVSDGLRGLADELRSMAAGSTQQGVGADLARQLSDHADKAGSWLSDRDPNQLLDDVRSFARSRPGTFLGIAAVAGVMAGRLGRGLKDGPTDGPTTGPTTGATTGPTGGYPS
jgi:hypothetical protein